MLYKVAFLRFGENLAYCTVCLYVSVCAFVCALYVSLCVCAHITAVNHEVEDSEEEKTKPLALKPARDVQKIEKLKCNGVSLEDEGNKSLYK